MFSTAGIKARSSAPVIHAPPSDPISVSFMLILRSRNIRDRSRSEFPAKNYAHYIAIPRRATRYIITNSMHLSPSQEEANRAATQEPSTGPYPEPNQSSPYQPHPISLRSL
jgi:hypothetical protein